MAKSVALFGIERWLPVQGYEGLYQISSFGQVRSLARSTVQKTGRVVSRQERMLKLTVDSEGYLKVSLSKNNRAKTVRVHVLVMTAFVGPAPEGQEVRHRNGIRIECALSNLEYGSSLLNNHDKRSHGTTGIGSAAAMAKLTVHKVTRMRRLYSKGAVTMQGLAGQFDICVSQVHDCIHFKHWDPEKWLRDIRAIGLRRPDKRYTLLKEAKILLSPKTHPKHQELSIILQELSHV